MGPEQPQVHALWLQGAQEIRSGPVYDRPVHAQFGLALGLALGLEATSTGPAPF